MTVEERKHTTEGDGANACSSDGHDLEEEVIILQPTRQVHPCRRFQSTEVTRGMRRRGGTSGRLHVNGKINTGHSSSVNIVR